MRQLNVLLAVLVSVALALGVLEIGLRIAGFGFPETVNRFDPETGWSKEAGKTVESSTRDFDVTLSINEMGLRDDPMASPGKTGENVFRVLFLGDSFTLGSTVDRGDLYVDLLERWWHAEERRADAVNAGTEGWSTDQEARWFQVRGADFEPDLVVLQAYENDLYWCGQTDYFGRDKPRYESDGTLEQRALVDRGRTGGFARSALVRFLRGLVGGTGQGPHRFRPAAGEKSILREFAAVLEQPPEFQLEAQARAHGALTALRDAVRDAGAELVVVPIPSQSAVDEDHAVRFGERTLGLPREAWDPNRPVQWFLDAAGELGVTAIDVRGALRERIEAGDDLYHEIDWHLDPEGNRVLAATLHDALDETGAFPASHRALAEASMPESTSEGGGDGLPGWLPVFGVLWILLSALYATNYRDEPLWRVPLQVGLLLGLVFAIVLGGGALLRALPPTIAVAAGWLFVLAILGFVIYKLGRRVGTIAELLTAFTRRGHWYLMPLVVVLLTIGSLLVVAASSPLVAPFIYTLF